MSKEAKSRIKINKLLEEAGWRFFDDDNGKANIILENNAKLTSNELDELGEDFEKTSNGFIDYLLLDNKGFPFIVLEAKKERNQSPFCKRTSKKNMLNPKIADLSFYQMGTYIISGIYKEGTQYHCKIS